MEEMQKCFMIADLMLQELKYQKPRLKELENILGVT